MLIQNKHRVISQFNELNLTFGSSGAQFSKFGVLYIINQLISNIELHVTVSQSLTMFIISVSKSF